jgi:hypothetical protein
MTTESYIKHLKVWHTLNYKRQKLHNTSILLEISFFFVILQEKVPCSCLYNKNSKMEADIYFVLFTHFLRSVNIYKMKKTELNNSKP